MGDGEWHGGARAAGPDAAAVLVGARAAAVDGRQQRSAAGQSDAGSEGDERDEVAAVERNLSDAALIDVEGHFAARGLQWRGIAADLDGLRWLADDERDVEFGARERQLCTKAV